MLHGRFSSCCRHGFYYSVTSAIPSPESSAVPPGRVSHRGPKKKASAGCFEPLRVRPRIQECTGLTVRSSWPLWVGRSMRYNGGTNGRRRCKPEQSPKTTEVRIALCNWRACKRESLVIAYQRGAVNKYLGFVHTAHHAPRNCPSGSGPLRGGEPVRSANRTAEIPAAPPTGGLLTGAKL